MLASSREQSAERRSIHYLLSAPKTLWRETALEACPEKQPVRQAQMVPVQRIEVVKILMRGRNIVHRRTRIGFANENCGFVEAATPGEDLTSQ